MHIWNMCIGLFGVQIVWGLQNVDTSRIFQTLGAEIAQLPILWIAAPITGLLIQPLIGYWSDRTWGPLGRRRPFVLGGALMTAAAMVVMPNVTSLFAASVALWLLTASVNIAAEPFRALVADNLPDEQRTEGYAVQVFFIGAGAVFSSALPWILSHGFGVAGVAPPGQLPATVRLSFEIGAAGLVATVLWTVLTTRERPPQSLAADARDHARSELLSAAAAVTLTRSGVIWTVGGVVIAVLASARGLEREIYVLAAIATAFGLAQLAVVAMRRRGHRSLGLFEIVEDILHMPPVMRRLAVVQFLTWFGLFCFWIYAIPGVSSHHYGTTDTASAAYNEAADWVGILFAGYNAVAAVGALLLPAIAQRIGRPATHAACLVAGAAGLLGFVLIDDPTLLWMPVIGIGCAWASILALPYAMIAGAVPPDKMGVYMGIHNTFLVLPQLVAATVLGAIVNDLLGGQAILALGLAAAALLAAAVAALTIDDSQHV
ncbi:MFS transporter [Sphingomonas bacterium]|uniref:MFS transporter n=1 Tax=Sphingomonas bacterium TaxID=1895847 RepID=UPI0026309851|nr:MFS transporter [Sphingomonas bacterium]